MPRTSPLRNRVKELRERLNVRQSELAQEAGITRQTIIALEAGRYAPSLELAFRLARAFGVGIEAVFQDPASEPGAEVAAVDGPGHG